MPSLKDEREAPVPDLQRRARRRFITGVFAVLIASGMVLIGLLLYTARRTPDVGPVELPRDPTNVSSPSSDP